MCTQRIAAYFYFLVEVYYLARYVYTSGRRPDVFLAVYYTAIVDTVYVPISRHHLYLEKFC